MKVKDDNKVQLIFKATLNLVLENGLAGVKMCDIAREAGLATGTVYIYFQNKDELINALFLECRKASANVYFTNYNVSAPFKEGFKTIWLNLLTYRLENFTEAIFIEQCYHSPYITESNKEIIKQVFEPLYQLMERGKEEGLIKNLDTFLLLSFIVGNLNEIVKHVRYSGKTFSNEMIEDTFTLCWDGIKKTGV